MPPNRFWRKAIATPPYVDMKCHRATCRPYQAAAQRACRQCGSSRLSALVFLFPKPCAGTAAGNTNKWRYGWVLGLDLDVNLTNQIASGNAGNLTTQSFTDDTCPQGCLLLRERTDYPNRKTTTRTPAYDLRQVNMIFLAAGNRQTAVNRNASCQSSFQLGYKPPLVRVGNILSTAIGSLDAMRTNNI